MRDDFFQHHLPHYYRSILDQFKKISQSFVRFNLLFGVIFFSELAVFLYFLRSLNHSAILAFALGGLFLTCFSYFILLFYFQSKKPEQLYQLREAFRQACKQHLSAPHHLIVAEALQKLSHYLQDFEWHITKAPSFLPFLAPLASRFSATCYWGDVFKLKQLLLQAAIDEHLQQIRFTPTDLEVHASLANAYVAFSALYALGSDQHPRIGRMRKLQPEFDEKFRIYSCLAIEEFKILKFYAQNDPWVHERLSQCYCNLKMPEEEVKEVESLLKLKPQDKEILFRLGVLYFRQGMNAKGLQIYNELKQAHHQKADDLISIYGSSDKFPRSLV